MLAKELAQIAETLFLHSFLGSEWDRISYQRHGELYVEHKHVGAQRCRVGKMMKSGTSINDGKTMETADKLLAFSRQILR